MRKTTFSLSSALVAGVLGAVLMPASSAFATEGFACPDGTDTIAVTYGYTADNTPELAGTVCVLTGTTVFQSMDVTDGWTADLRSTGSKGRTEVRFYNSTTGNRVELRYEAGRTEIK